MSSCSMGRNQRIREGLGVLCSIINILFNESMGLSNKVNKLVVLCFSKIGVILREESSLFGVIQSTILG